MKSIIEVVSLAGDYLKSKGLRAGRRDAEELLASSLNLKRIDLYLHFDRPLEEWELTGFREMVKRRARGEPVLYIIGKTFFYNSVISLTSDVLIPRPETELLVEHICKTLEKEDLRGKKLFDMCTGSGCIAIALKKRFPELQVFASDISAEALALAKKNSLSNAVDITFLEGNLLEPFSSRCDYFVSNPPYLSQEEFDSLDFQVKDYEPKLALLGGVDGAAFYVYLAKELKNKINLHGKIWLEMGASQGNCIKKIFIESGWGEGRVDKDYAGHDRFFFLERDSFDKVL